MSTPATQPIAIRNSPSRPWQTDGRPSVEAQSAAPRAQANEGSTTAITLPTPASPSSPSASSEMPALASRPSRHSRKPSRIDMLTELLLPDAAFAVPRFDDPSSEADRRRSAPGAPSIDAERAEALRTALNAISAKDVLEASQSRPPLVLHQDTSIDAVCQRIVNEAHPGPILLSRNSMDVENALRGGPTGRTCASIAGILSLEDLHGFFCLLFCSPTKEPGKILAAGPARPSSPPTSPIGKIAPINSIHTSRARQSMGIRELVKAGKPVSASLVANLSGSNELRTISSGTGLQDVISQLLEPGVGYLVVQDADAIDADASTAPLGLISSMDVFGVLSRDTPHNEAIAAVLSERIDELSSLGFTSIASPISSDKSVLDAMALMDSEGVQTVAILDARGVLLSSLSSAEVTFEVIRAESRKILSTSLSTLVKTLRSRRPEGTDGKDTHPAVSVSLSSQLARAASLMQATSTQGIFVLDDLVPAMTPPLSTISPSSPTAETNLWGWGADLASSGHRATASSHEAETGSRAGSGSKASHHRRSSTSFGTMPRSRAAAPATSGAAGAAGASLARLFLASEGGGAKSIQADAAGAKSTLATSFTSSCSPPIAAAVGGPGFVRCHRPRSISLVPAMGADSLAWRREGNLRASLTAPSATDAGANLSPSTSLSAATGSSSSSARGGSGSGSVSSSGSSSSLSLSQITTASSASWTGASWSLASPHLGGTGSVVALAESSCVAPVRFHLSSQAALRFVAHCAAGPSLR
ncbi:cell separation during budding [Thecaphora frezii]